MAAGPGKDDGLIICVRDHKTFSRYGDATIVMPGWLKEGLDNLVRFNGEGCEIVFPIKEKKIFQVPLQQKQYSGCGSWPEVAENLQRLQFLFLATKQFLVNDSRAVRLVAPKQ
ncbi:unnamed protein product [Clavelina lepadiformis]|uniref:Uncharacterized protein n=1 Tax=Clavelina lepadiformis TaxID=159417 RepID=A0ABP0EY89_CLALP